MFGFGKKSSEKVEATCITEEMQQSLENHPYMVGYRLGHPLPSDEVELVTNPNDPEFQRGLRDGVEMHEQLMRK